MSVEAIRPNTEKISWKKRTLAGAGLGGGDFLLGQGIQIAAATEGATTGFMRPLIENHSSGAILASAIAAGFAVAAVGAYQNTRLLKEDKIGVSPNAVGTFVFHSVDRIWPSKESAMDFLIRPSLTVAAIDVRLIAPTAIVFNLAERICPSKETARNAFTQAAQVLVTKDYFLITPVLANERALAAFVTAKVATSAFTLFKAVISEFVLGKARSEKKIKKEKTEIRAAGVVFAPQPSAD